MTIRGTQPNPVHLHAVFDALEEVTDAHGLDGDLPINDHTVAQVTAVARVKAGATHRELRAVQVKRWLSDQRHYSPYVDHVLVTRARNFEPDVLDALSPADYDAFLERLARASDPWGLDGQSPFTPPEGNRKGLTGEWSSEGIRAYEATEREWSQRRINWMALPEWRRNHITEAVRKIRENGSAA